MARKIKRHRPAPQMVEALRNMRAVAGKEREAYFANGGDPRQWRPRRQVTVDKRKRDNKRKCRGRVRL